MSYLCSQRRMKLSATLTILALFMSANARLASAEEKPGPIITALSSTTISGYVHAGTHWQTHVCRPVRPVRAQRVVVDPADGPPRVVGHTVRCRHAVVFVPNATGARAFPTPNRSSRFGPVSSRTATVQIDHQTQLVIIEAHRRYYSQPGIPYPPLPPTRPSTNLFPGSVTDLQIMMREPRFLDYQLELSPERRSALVELMRQLQERPPDVPPDSSLDSRRLWLDRRPIFQPPARFVRESQ
jgi:hypothetical protein